MGELMDPIGSETHRRLLALLARGQADQDTLAEHLSPEERAARGELYAWSPKDHVAHNNFWRQDAVSSLKAALDGGSLPDLEDTQTLNDRVFQEQRETPWEELVAETARLRAEAAALIQRLSPDDLTQRDRYPWQRGERGGSLERVILTNWYEHPAEHWGDIYVSHNELDRALEVRRAVVTTVGELFAHDPRTFGYVSYNLGCFYARTGRAEQAVDTIREALPLVPALAEHAKQDPDLDALHALPAFQALYES
jgi:tetratricopeptide (TPR) repeat protein